MRLGLAFGLALGLGLRLALGLGLRLGLGLARVCFSPGLGWSYGQGKGL